MVYIAEILSVQRHVVEGMAPDFYLHHRHQYKVCKGTIFGRVNGEIDSWSKSYNAETHCLNKQEQIFNLK